MLRHSILESGRSTRDAAIGSRIDCTGDKAAGRDDKIIVVVAAQQRSELRFRHYGLPCMRRSRRGQDRLAGGLLKSAKLSLPDPLPIARVCALRRRSVAKLSTLTKFIRRRGSEAEELEISWDLLEQHVRPDLVSASPLTRGGEERGDLGLHDHFADEGG